MPRILTPAAAIGRSIVKDFRKTLWTPCAMALKRYELLHEGDRAAVLLDGTTASVLSAMLLKEMSLHSWVHFECRFYMLPHVQETAALLGLDAQLLPDAALFSQTALQDGCTALAVHDCFNDVIETTMHALLNEGRLRTLLPVEQHDAFRIIRPLYAIQRKDMALWAESNALPYIPSPVSADAQAAGDLLRRMMTVCPDIEKNVFAAVHQIDMDTFPKGFDMDADGSAIAPLSLEQDGPESEV